MSTDCGARGLLVFPPEMTWLGFREEMVVEHFRHVTDNTDLPLILFQYPSRTAFCYPLSLITKLCGLYPQIRAVKDMVGDPVLHEQQIRELHALPRPVRVLTTHSAWLLGSLALGCDGLLSGAGSVIADLHVALFQAVKQDNLGLARRINDRIYPLTRAFYDPPLVDMHNRMKEALVLLGRLPRATVRPPLHKLTDAEVARIRRQLVLGGMLAD
jgi:4-hydroxy-tetrahydrodipicolinate synthase